jgi:hypothetical protein
VAAIGRISIGPLVVGIPVYKCKNCGVTVEGDGFQLPDSLDEQIAVAAKKPFLYHVCKSDEQTLHGHSLKTLGVCDLVAVQQRFTG